MIISTTSAVDASTLAVGTHKGEKAFKDNPLTDEWLKVWVVTYHQCDQIDWLFVKYLAILQLWIFAQ